MCLSSMGYTFWMLVECKKMLLSSHGCVNARRNGYRSESFQNTRLSILHCKMNVHIHVSLEMFFSSTCILSCKMDIHVHVDSGLGSALSV
jgi:hypothetical protein